MITDDVRKALLDGDCTTDEMRLDRVSNRRIHDALCSLIELGHVEKIGHITKEIVVKRRMSLYKLTNQGRYRLEHPYKSQRQRKGKRGETKV